VGDLVLIPFPLAIGDAGGSHPRGGEERDCDERTMGMGLTHSTSMEKIDISRAPAEKKCGCRTSTPQRPKQRDSDEGTMGGVNGQRLDHLDIV
jgi:hypothetical protein